MDGLVLCVADTLPIARAQIRRLRNVDQRARRDDIRSCWHRRSGIAAVVRPRFEPASRGLLWAGADREAAADASAAQRQRRLVSWDARGPLRLVLRVRRERPQLRECSDLCECPTLVLRGRLPPLSQPPQLRMQPRTLLRQRLHRALQPQRQGRRRRRPRRSRSRPCRSPRLLLLLRLTLLLSQLLGLPRLRRGFWRRLRWLGRQRLLLCRAPSPPSPNSRRHALAVAAVPLGLPAAAAVLRVLAGEPQRAQHRHPVDREHLLAVVGGERAADGRAAARAMDHVLRVEIEVGGPLVEVPQRREGRGLRAGLAPRLPLAQLAPRAHVGLGRHGDGRQQSLSSASVKPLQRDQHPLHEPKPTPTPLWWSRELNKPYRVALRPTVTHWALARGAPSPSMATR
eukprot:COSAG04_NODE_4645_length_1974_cov_6.144000_1_plen_399_part_00